MLRYFFISAFIVGFLLFPSCNMLEGTNETTTDSNTDKKGDNLIKKYYPDGKIKAEISVKDKKRHGTSKTYYENGVVRQSIDYTENLKDGIAQTNYESGKPYQITRYVKGKKQGIREHYRQDGRLMSEMPYYQDKPCAGVKEYLLDETLKQHYPSIVIAENNRIALDNTFILRISLSEKAKDVKFYIGELDENGCIGQDVYWMKAQKPGVLEIKYEVPPGMFLMEEMNFIVTFNTNQGNTYFARKSYNLAIENRGI